MSKLSGLQAQLEKASGRGSPVLPSPSFPSSSRDPVLGPSAVSLPDPSPRSPRQSPPSRVGKVHIGAYLSPDFRRSLRLVQAQTGEDTQTLLARALNDLFRSHNVPVIDL